MVKSKEGLEVYFQTRQQSYFTCLKDSLILLSKKGIDVT